MASFEAMLSQTDAVEAIYKIKNCAESFWMRSASKEKDENKDNRADCALEIGRKRPGFEKKIDDEAGNYEDYKENKGFVSLVDEFEGDFV